MRLLTYNIQSGLYVTRDLADNDIPRYAILSHTWGADDEEVTFHQVQSQPCKAKAGYAKIDFCRRQAQKDGLQHFWIDTCCIDKTNHVELSEAITSMYRWYQRAQICYVYLADVSSGRESQYTMFDDCQRKRPWELSFRKSRWFTRGWTLQELLAPREVVFYSKEGDFLGTRSDFKDLLHEITNIPTPALSGCSLSQYSVTERLRWTRGRMTKKKEDQAYCLLGIFNVFMPLNYGEGDHAFIRLTRKISKMPKITVSLRTATSAIFDSYSQAHRDCHPATRVSLLQSVRDWTREVNGESIFWLNGMAGTGKSTISRTVARWLASLDAGQSIALGASFFFKRGEVDRSSAALLFSTIAHQLAANINGFDSLLAQAVDADPQICDKSLGEQFNRLISEPLQQVRSDKGHMTYVVVMDALDECESENEIRTLLRLWSQLPATNIVRLRLFLTSRPELVIRLGFRKMSTDVHHDLILHEIPEPVIRHDIHAFLTDALAEVREEHNLEIFDEPLSENWPGREALQELTTIAVPLFIVASTICRLIRDADHPQRCLATILRSRNVSHLSETGKIYILVLEAMTQSMRNKQDVLRAHHEFRVIVGTIVTLAEPLSRAALAALLDITPSGVQIRLRPLHAVLEVPSDGDALIRPLHLSFAEYLTSQEVQGTPYWVHTTATHNFLWRKCLQLLASSTGLRENVCQLSHPGQLRSEVPDAQVDKNLRAEVRYACRYWVHHLRSSESRICDDDQTHIFLQQHFIHWLEALSFTGRLADATDFVTILQSRLAEDRSSRTAAFLNDARRFILAFRQIGEQAPLQLYASAVAFAPETSVVRRVCSQPLFWIHQHPITPLKWTSELEKLEGHNAEVNGVTFSPDGSLLASAGSDGTIRLWEVRTGRELQKLTSSANVEHKKVVFSPDGLLLASVGSDRTARLWEVSTGLEVQKLQDNSVTAAMFSPRGLLLATASWNKYVQLWKMWTNQGWLKSEKLGTVGRVATIAFSPDGALLAAAGSDGLVQLWDTERGQEIHKLQGKTNWIHAVLFSSNGCNLASAGDEGIIRLWDVKTGQEAQRSIRRHSSVRTLAISPDGSLLASADDTASIWLWDAQTGQEVRELKERDHQVNMIAFSPSDPLLASAGEDGMIRLWRVKSGQQLQKRKRYANPVIEMAVSPDGLLIVTADSNAMLRIWNVATGYVIQKIETGARRIKEMVFSRNRRFLAAAGSMGVSSIIWIWNVSTGKEIQQFDAPEISEVGGLMASMILFSPKGSLLFATVTEEFLNDKILMLQKIGTQWIKQRFELGDTRKEMITFSRDGSLLASVSYDENVQVWEVGTGQLAHIFKSDCPIESLSFSPDNNLSINNDFTLALVEKDGPGIKPCLDVNHDWIECQGKKLLWLPQEYRSECSLVFGTMIAIGRRDGIVSFFRIDYPPDHAELERSKLSMCEQPMKSKPAALGRHQYARDSRREPRDIYEAWYLSGL